MRGDVETWSGRAHCCSGRRRTSWCPPTIRSAVSSRSSSGRWRRWHRRSPRCTPRPAAPRSRRNTSGRRSAIDGRTTRHPGYCISQRLRKRVEEIFDWTKTVGGGRKLRYLGLARNQCWAELTTAAYNLVRMVKLLPAAP